MDSVAFDVKKERPTFQEVPDAALLCKFCNKALLDPVRGSCEHRFCRECTDGRISCPCGMSFGMLADDVESERLLDKLLVECPHRSKGCFWTRAREKLETHLQRTCKHAGRRAARSNSSQNVSRAGSTSNIASGGAGGGVAQEMLVIVGELESLVAKQALQLQAARQLEETVARQSKELELGQTLKEELEGLVAKNALELQEARQETRDARREIERLTLQLEQVLRERELEKEKDIARKQRELREREALQQQASREQELQQSLLRKERELAEAKEAKEKELRSLREAKEREIEAIRQQEEEVQRRRESVAAKAAEAEWDRIEEQAKMERERDEKRKQREEEAKARAQELEKEEQERERRREERRRERASRRQQREEEAKERASSPPPPAAEKAAPAPASPPRPERRDRRNSRRDSRGSESMRRLREAEAAVRGKGGGAGALRISSKQEMPPDVEPVSEAALRVLLLVATERLKGDSDLRSDMPLTSVPAARLRLLLCSGVLLGKVVSRLHPGLFDPLCLRTKGGQQFWRPNLERVFEAAATFLDRRLLEPILGGSTEAAIVALRSVVHSAFVPRLRRQLKDAGGEGAAFSTQDDEAHLLAGWVALALDEEPKARSRISPMRAARALAAKGPFPKKRDATSLTELLANSPLDGAIADESNVPLDAIELVLLWSVAKISQKFAARSSIQRTASDTSWIDRMSKK